MIHSENSCAVKYFYGNHDNFFQDAMKNRKFKGTAFT